LSFKDERSHSAALQYQEVQKIFLKKMLIIKLLLCSYFFCLKVSDDSTGDEIENATTGHALSCSVPYNKRDWILNKVHTFNIQNGEYFFVTIQLN
jgi:hypothetical protein